MRVDVICFRPPGKGTRMKRSFQMLDSRMPATAEEAITRSLVALEKSWPGKPAGYWAPAGAVFVNTGRSVLVGSVEPQRRGPGPVGEHPPLEWEVNWLSDAAVAGAGGVWERLIEVIEGKRPLKELI